MFIRWKWGIRTWLFLLPVLSGIPMLIFSSFAIYELGVTWKSGIEQALTDGTEACAEAVNQRLNVALAGLRALSASAVARQGDLSELHAYARRILPSFPDVLAISLVRTDGQIMFTTLRPFGEPLPAVSDSEAQKRACDSERPTISGPFKGRVSQEMVMSVSVPAIIGEAQNHCLRMTIKTSQFYAILEEQHLPQDWRAILFNQDGITITRTMAPVTSAGTKISAGLAAAILKGQRGILDIKTRDGVLTKSVLVALPSWALSIAVGVPVDSLNAPLRQAMVRLGMGGAAFLTLSLMAAGWLSRRLAKDIARVAAASSAIEQGKQTKIPRTIIHELHVMGTALSHTKERESQMAVALEAAVETQQKISEALDNAKRDHLTGLTRRSAFLEQIESIHSSLGNTEDKIAILFIDLDNFKQVNDTHGHEKGDEILKRVGQTLRSTLRDKDVAGRLGGDEFVICVSAPETVIEATAIAVAQRIIAGTREIGYGIGCSIGIAVCVGVDDTIADMIKTADEAMYAAKKLGKNRFILSDVYTHRRDA